MYLPGPLTGLITSPYWYPYLWSVSWSIICWSMFGFVVLWIRKKVLEVTCFLIIIVIYVSCRHLENVENCLEENWNPTAYSYQISSSLFKVLPRCTNQWSEFSGTTVSSGQHLYKNILTETPRHLISSNCIQVGYPQIHNYLGKNHVMLLAGHVTSWTQAFIF